ncbi:transglycosylase SLT domain-containing protein (plasmid) [Myxococcus sp. MxC21-1]|uniref:lytic transglycosylase domain-containing protein n=1 Tax=Myxococcus sp. MxC21-1 TaxID=3041439 RepID=UPI002930010B|nr:transglycosylase SLT domain-containing protein [Myxococcus sp. MxC21-1]WNZ66230.1 transglycosylase SLT domain-containing protein [Myxococcus sp. MxC21-1]
MLLLVAVVLVAAPSFHAPTPYEREIEAACKATADIWPVPPELVKAVIRRESAFNPRARSAVGAIGLMQIMPFTAPKVGVRVADLEDPATNILAGTRLLAVLLREYQGDLKAVLVGYNARPRPAGAPLPDNGETPAYVQAVLRFFFAYREAAELAAAAKSVPQTSAASRSTRNPPGPPTQQGGPDQP